MIASDVDNSQNCLYRPRRPSAMANQGSETHQVHSQKRQSSPIFGTVNKYRIVYGKRTGKDSSSKHVTTKRARKDTATLQTKDQESLTISPLATQEQPDVDLKKKSEQSRPRAPCIDQLDDAQMSSQPPFIPSSRAPMRDSDPGIPKSDKAVRNETERKVGRYDQDGNRLAEQMFSQVPMKAILPAKRTVKRNKLICLPDLQLPQDNAKQSLVKQDARMQNHELAAAELLSDNTSTSSCDTECQPVSYSLSSLRRQVKPCLLRTKDLSKSRRRKAASGDRGGQKLIGDGFEPHEVHQLRHPFRRTKTGRMKPLPFRPRIAMVGEIVMVPTQRPCKRRIDIVKPKAVQEVKMRDAADEVTAEMRAAVDDQPLELDVDVPCNAAERDTNAQVQAVEPGEPVPAPKVAEASQIPATIESTSARAPKRVNSAQSQSRHQMVDNSIDTIAALTSAYELCCVDSARFWPLRRSQARSSESISAAAEINLADETHTHHTEENISTQRSTLQAPRWSINEQKPSVDIRGTFRRCHDRIPDIQVPGTPGVVSGGPLLKTIFVK